MVYGMRMFMVLLILKYSDGHSKTSLQAYFHYGDRHEANVRNDHVSGPFSQPDDAIMYDNFNESGQTLWKPINTSTLPIEHSRILQISIPESVKIDNKTYRMEVREPRMVSSTSNGTNKPASTRRIDVALRKRSSKGEILYKGASYTVPDYNSYNLAPNAAPYPHAVYSDSASYTKPTYSPIPSYTGPTYPPETTTDYVTPTKEVYSDRAEVYEEPKYENESVAQSAYSSEGQSPYKIKEATPNYIQHTYGPPSSHSTKPSDSYTVNEPYKDNTYDKPTKPNSNSESYTDTYPNPMKLSEASYSTGDNPYSYKSGESLYKDAVNAPYSTDAKGESYKQTDNYVADDKYSDSQTEVPRYTEVEYVSPPIYRSSHQTAYTDSKSSIEGPYSKEKHESSKSEYAQTYAYGSLKVETKGKSYTSDETQDVYKDLTYVVPEAKSNIYSGVYDKTDTEYHATSQPYEHVSTAYPDDKNSYSSGKSLYDDNKSVGTKVSVYAENYNELPKYDQVPEYDVEPYKQKVPSYDAIKYQDSSSTKASVEYKDEKDYGNVNYESPKYAQSYAYKQKSYEETKNVETYPEVKSDYNNYEKPKYAGSYNYKESTYDESSDYKTSSVEKYAKDDYKTPEQSYSDYSSPKYVEEEYTPKKVSLEPAKETNNYEAPKYAGAYSYKENKDSYATKPYKEEYNKGEGYKEDSYTQDSYSEGQRSDEYGAVEKITSEYNNNEYAEKKNGDSYDSQVTTEYKGGEYEEASYSDSPSDDHQYTMKVAASGSPGGVSLALKDKDLYVHPIHIKVEVYHHHQGHSPQTVYKGEGYASPPVKRSIRKRSIINHEQAARETLPYPLISPSRSINEKYHSYLSLIGYSNV